MNPGRSAADRLRLGDEIERLAEEGVALDEAAFRMDVSLYVARKARWLARAYTPAERNALGEHVLASICASHLEVVINAGRDRAHLLRTSAREGLSVRQTRAVASQPTTLSAPNMGVTNIGTAADLVSAAESLTRYATWNSAQLQKLLAGPNGAVIRELASAGRILADRLDTGSISHQ